MYKIAIAFLAATSLASFGCKKKGGAGEAMEMMKLIRRYTDPRAAWNVLQTEYQAVELSDGKAAVKVSVTNRGDKPAVAYLVMTYAETLA